MFVAIDYFSRFCTLQPIMNKKAETIVSIIYSHIIADFTTPRTIITDNGTEFNNRILEELCKLFHEKKVNVQAYHPHSNGIVERLNRKNITCSLALINPYSTEWDKWIPIVKCDLNTQVNSATGESPHLEKISCYHMTYYLQSHNQFTIMVTTMQQISINPNLSIAE